MAAGAVGAALTLAPPAEARNYWSGTAILWCSNHPRVPFNTSCTNPLYPRGGYLAMLDFAPDPTARLGSFQLNFYYDPSLLSFNKDATTLLCDLRTSSSPLCPSFPPGR